MNLVKLNPPLSRRARPQDPTIIVLHATAGATARSSIDHLRSVGLSYHYIIARDGADSKSFDTAKDTDPLVFHCTEERFRASHVGSQVPPPAGRGSFNDLSVGISLANLQTTEKYTPQQFVALDEVIAEVLRNAPTIKHLTTHAVIQPWNRGDPRKVDGEAIAGKHGLKWFQPTADVIRRFTPPPTRRS